MSEQIFVEQIFKTYGWFERDFAKRWFMPTCYPIIQVQIHNKTEPGLQVADYLLWAIFREDKHEMMAKLHLHQCMSCSIVQEKGGYVPNEATFVLGKGGVLQREYFAAYPIFNPDSIMQDSKRYQLEDVRKIIRELATAPLPTHVKHLSELLIMATNICSYDGPHHNWQAELLFVTFLQFFDTLPLYSINDPENMERMLALKLYVAKQLNAIRLRQGTMTIQVHAYTPTLTADDYLCCDDPVAYTGKHLNRVRLLPKENP